MGVLANLTLGRNPVADWHPSRGQKRFFLLFYVTEIRILSSGGIGHLANIDLCSPCHTGRILALSIFCIDLTCGRCGGLMVSAVDPRSNSPGLSPGRGTALCFRARHFTLIVPLSLYWLIYSWG